MLIRPKVVRSFFVCPEGKEAFLLKGAFARSSFTVNMLTIFIKNPNCLAQKSFYDVEVSRAFFSPLFVCGVIFMTSFVCFVFPF